VSRRRELYCGHARLCVRLCVYLSAAACPHYCTDPDVTWGHGRGCSLAVHYWEDLQSVHGLRCYGNITRTRNASKHMLVLALCLVLNVFTSKFSVGDSLKACGRSRSMMSRHAKDEIPVGLFACWAEAVGMNFGSRPSDHYFRSVCLFVCLFVCSFVQSFSQPSSIRFGSN